jgi:hypothetical protein
MRLLLTDVNSLLHLFLQALTFAEWTSKPPSQSQALKPPLPVNWESAARLSAGGSKQVDCLPCGYGNGRLWKPCPRRLQPILRLPPADPYPCCKEARIFLARVPVRLDATGLLWTTTLKRQTLHEGGLDAGGGMPLRLRCCSRVMVNLHGCSSRVKHPTTRPLDTGICHRRGGCNPHMMFNHRPDTGNHGLAGLTTASIRA